MKAPSYRINEIRTHVYIITSEIKMKAIKLPSGNYRAQVYDKKTGKRAGKTFPTKKEAERWANAWYIEHNEITGMTFDRALDQYINDREAVLSPGTVREYRRCQKLYSQFDGIQLENISDRDIQKYINSAAHGLSPKSVKNLYGIISAVFRTYAPNRRLCVSIPKVYRPNIEVPTEGQIRAILDASKGRSVEVPILLAVFAGMRRGEIAALKISDVSGNVIHVQRALSLNDQNEYVEKPPKSVAGDRFVPCPEWIIEKLPTYLENPLAPQGIESGYKRVLAAAGVPHYRFHALRHYCASMKHALGIPDVYIMQQLGWSNDSCLKNIYRHTIKEQEQKNNDAWMEYANSFVCSSCAVDIRK